MGVKWTNDRPATDRTTTKGRDDMTTTTTRVLAIFPDGTMYEAPTWVALEDVLMEDVWNPSTPAAYRQAMTQRADVWSGWQLNPNARAEMFLRGMEKAGMCRLETITNDNDSKGA